MTRDKIEEIRRDLGKQNKADVLQSHDELRMLLQNPDLEPSKSLIPRVREVFWNCLELYLKSHQREDLLSEPDLLDRLLRFDEHAFEKWLDNPTELA